MSKFAVCRIVGNELFPRDIPDSRLKSLKFILETENIDVQRIWILNRIIDQSYLAKVKEVLAGETTYVIPFDYTDYRKAVSFDEKVLAAISINNARNFGLSKSDAEYTALLDEDCFFYPDHWGEVKSFIENNPSKFYACITKRIDQTTENVMDAYDEEPMLIFNKTAKLRFDEFLPFGRDDKRRLLRKLGWHLNSKIHKFNTNKEICPFAGYVMHMAHGDAKVENDVEYRIQQRRKSLENLLKIIEDKINGIKFL
jgi:hypothetical protein